MRHSNQLSVLTIGASLTIIGITSFLCFTAIRFAEAPNGVRIDVEAQPRDVRVRASVTVGNKRLLTQKQENTYSSLKKKAEVNPEEMD